MKKLREIPRMGLVHCPINAMCEEAYNLLGEWEKAVNLGWADYLPDFAKKPFDALSKRTSGLLDKAIPKKQRKEKKHVG